MSDWCLRLAVLLSVVAVAVPAAATDLGWLDDRAAVQNFVSGVVTEQLAERQAVGVTVSIVRGGNIVMAQGYGVADLATGRNVSAQDSLFRIGSVSKLFVWVAVMQQVAAGRLDLNADVNKYLTDLQIPETFPEPITLARLMTHTPGFEDKLLGLFAQGPRTVGNFHDNLVTMLPRRVMMPGRYAAYSNYGAALAARLVEIASGEDWDEYVQRHILQPLGMLHTTTKQPVGDALQDQLASGYWWKHDRYQLAPFVFVTLPPAGSISATATDMARFMTELLAHGDSSVMSAAARARLFAPGFAHDPRLNGVLGGLYEQNSHGQKMMGHRGDALAFFSEVLLCPALDLGIFVSYNSDRGDEAQAMFMTALLDRLFGRPAAAESKGTFAADRYVGYYSSLRAPVSGRDKIMALLSTLEVTANADGELLVRTQDRVRRFVPVDSDLFAEVDGDERIAFRVEGGHASNLFFDSLPYVDFARIQPRDNPLLQVGVVATALLLSAAVWLLWPLSWLRHRNRISQRGETRATLLAATTSILIIGYLVVIGSAIQNQREVVLDLPETFLQALWIPIALVPILLLQLVFTYGAWVSGWWWVARRIHYTLLTFAAIAFVVWAFYWHLTAVIVDF